MGRRRLNYGRHSVDQTDVDAVVAVLRSEFLTQGPAVPRFEDAVKELVGARHAVAFSSGTAALHGAVWAAGMEKGDVGVTQAITFCATANAVRFCGGEIALADIDFNSVNMSAGSLKKVMAKLEAEGRGAKVVLPVHIGGLSVGAGPLREAAGDALMIEDAAHALGGVYEDGQPIGSGTHADASVFSFHPVKPITSAEGGVAVTNDATLARRMRLLRNHGIERDKTRYAEANPDAQGLPWYYEQQELGYNYRLSDVHAALGLSQLPKLSEFTQRRRDLAALYDDAFQSLPGITPLQARPDWAQRSSRHLYLVHLDFETLSVPRAKLMNRLGEAGIGTQVHYIPIHHHPYYVSNPPIASADLGESERYYQGALSLPLFPDMDEADVERVVQALKTVIESQRALEPQI